MFTTSHLMVIVVLFLPAECLTEVLPPRNVSAVWKSVFQPGLSWLPPHNLTPNCTYSISFITKYSKENLSINASPWYSGNDVMEGGCIRWSISTVCQEKKSVPVVVNVSYPELVKNVSCYMYSQNQSRCEWLPEPDPPDLKFFYNLVDMCKGESSSASLVECSSYSYNKSMKTVCEIQATKCHEIYILFNGTLDTKPVMNTFAKRLKNDVRLPPLMWTATKNGNEINISWIPPDIFPDDWTMEINYTECGMGHKLISIQRETTFLLESLSHCQYNIAIRAESHRGYATWSGWKNFDAEQDSNMELLATSIIPIMFGFLTAFTCVCCQKNRRIIFPKVPKPKDFLTDSVNNKASKLYIPEEEDCKICLVLDLENTKAEC